MLVIFISQEDIKTSIMCNITKTQINKRFLNYSVEIHICIFNKMQKTGFKHKYPTIEFNSENPKKEC